MLELYGRSDYAIIGELIEPKTRVLDLGCGEGELLAWLKEHKQVDGRGVELTGASVQKAIARGVSVYQGDLESALEDYPSGAFDYAILSQTLQETREPLARASRDAPHREPCYCGISEFRPLARPRSRIYGAAAPRKPSFSLTTGTIPRISTS